MLGGVRFLLWTPLNVGVLLGFGMPKGWHFLGYLIVLAHIPKTVYR